jgi:NAD(P)-dependent dehydrogenase (short-subunit alcohol dehydrogenase family)
MQLEDKKAVITGSGSGVGRASAQLFAAEGASVVCVDLDEDAAKETVRMVEDAGGTAVAVRADVSAESDVAAAIGVSVEQFGGLDVMFNNVGIPTPRLGSVLEDHTAADFERLFAVNVGGVFFGCKHAVLRFKEQGTGGAIVNTGSVSGLVGWGGTVYGATKGAVHALTRSVAIEAAPHDIRVNAICPAAMPYTGSPASWRPVASRCHPKRSPTSRPTSAASTPSDGPSTLTIAPRRRRFSPRTGPGTSPA